MNATKALLLTDVVGSTQLLEELGDRTMADLWAAHDHASRSLLKAWRGREIDKSDGMLTLFDNCSDAVGYALAYHRALAALPHPLFARVGVHVGPVILRENGVEDVARGAKPLEVDGLTKPMAARVMAIARGGQTLLSASAREALPPSHHKLVSHGHWRFKGVSEPIELFEVGADDAACATPEDSEKGHRVARVEDWWLPVGDIPNNLPRQGTSFIGRDREVAQIGSLLAASRLVTLTGLGGIGKTRLSVQIAAGRIHDFPDGVWFIDLAPITDPGLVVAEAAKVLGVREEPHRPLQETLCEHLKRRRALLVLDNCEHLVHASAQLAKSILTGAQGVRILASSREALRIPDEQCFPVLPLPLPDRSAGYEALRGSAAVRLFVDRAKRHKPSFELAEGEVPSVAELVERLEGIPLAIELAAARIRALAVADINARLHDRYKLLSGGARGAQPRQQTLRALIDWSYELLTPEEQTLLVRLCIFVGGFDLAAAEAVCAFDPIAADDVLDALQSLIDKSLIVAAERQGSTRYRMLDTIREYGRDKLALSPARADIAARHCDHFFVMAKTANKGLRGPEQAQWLQRFDLEHDNMRSAFDLALAGGVDPVLTVKLAVALQGFWILRGHASEGRRRVQAALALPALRDSAQAQAFALYVGAALAESQSDHAAAKRLLEDCLALRRTMSSEVDIAATLSTFAVARLQAGDAAGAMESENEALGLFRSLGDRVGEAIGLLHLGLIARHLDDEIMANRHFEQCLALAKELRHVEVEGECEWLLGEIALEAGSLEEATRHLTKSLVVCREGGDMRGEANALRALGRADLKLGQLGSARMRLNDALRAFHAFDMRAELLVCIEDHAELGRAEGDASWAVRLAAMATQTRARLDLKRLPRIEQSWNQLVGQLRSALGDDSFNTAWLSGENLSVDDTMKLILPARIDTRQA